MSVLKKVTFESEHKLYKRLDIKPMWNQICTGCDPQGNISNIERDIENIGWIESYKKPSDIEQEEWIMQVIQPAINKNKWESYELCTICYQDYTDDPTENFTIEFSFDKIEIECCNCSRNTRIPKWYYNYVFRHQLFIDNFMDSRGYSKVIDGCDVIWYKDSQVNNIIILGRNFTG